ncbi:hypothetical protein [Flavobacterium sp. MK4S-17]|uniref:hypothetical protein n=1 Tax=Flavobacterium sp. MK4S-17 TaxID=2543737 RepID=UPI0013589F4D|nr:hypothetical protein [Flavobacterium sp. MK4S-17]
MTEIKIYQNTTPNKIAELYQEFVVVKSFDGIFLNIPSEFTTYRFGLLTELLKFVITLNSKSKIKVLKVEVDVNDVDTLYGQEYAYPIISLLWNTARFIDKFDNDFKDTLRFKQNEYFKKMNSLISLKGRKYLLSNTDHLSKNNGLIKFLENADGFNDDEDYIVSTVKKILNEYVLVFNQYNSSELEDIIEQIGEIVYELTKNTYEWGKTDANMKDIQSSIRGVYFRFHNNNFDKLTQEFENTPLHDFFSHSYIVDNCINDSNKVYYLEILVYDSGVGFIEKFNDKSGLSDIEVIKKCLIKNQTSSKSNLKTKKGLGLDRILTIIDKKGFIRITTDKYSIYRDLIKDNYIPITLEKLEDLKLNHWSKDGLNNQSLNRCQGSYISILYPFKKAVYNG